MDPLKPIKDAAGRVLRETGAHDFGRSLSSVDDLTLEVRRIEAQVEEVQQTLRSLAPLIERLVVAAEHLEEDIDPISRLASRIPGSGSRRRREQRREELRRARADLERTGRRLPPAAAAPPDVGRPPSGPGAP
ncbi:MAG: hypothetical protein M0P31_01590 [Solirubrobacteraceae bacterium]|nr:hypothetical protein [Solirubrobacteraceae bacterium]